MTMTTATAVCPGCHRDGDVAHDCQGQTTVADHAGTRRDAMCKCQVEVTCADWAPIDHAALPDLAAMYGTGA